jgi:hypothetical protein
MVHIVAWGLTGVVVVQEERGATEQNFVLYGVMTPVVHGADPEEEEEEMAVPGAMAVAEVVGERYGWQLTISLWRNKVWRHWVA